MKHSRLKAFSLICLSLVLSLTLALGVADLSRAASVSADSYSVVFDTGHGFANLVNSNNDNSAVFKTVGNFNYSLINKTGGGTNLTTDQNKYGYKINGTNGLIYVFIELTEPMTLNVYTSSNSEGANRYITLKKSDFSGKWSDLTAYSKGSDVKNAVEKTTLTAVPFTSVTPVEKDDSSEGFAGKLKNNAEVTTSADSLSYNYDVKGGVIVSYSALPAGYYAICSSPGEAYIYGFELQNAVTKINSIEGYTYNETSARYEANENAMTGTEAAALKEKLPAALNGAYGNGEVKEIAVAWGEAVVTESAITFTGTLTLPEGFTLASTTIVKTFNLTSEKTAVGAFENGAATVMVGSESVTLPESITDGNGVAFAATWIGEYDLGKVGTYTLTASVDETAYPAYDFTAAKMPGYVITVAPKTAVISESIQLEMYCDAAIEDLPAAIRADAFYGETALNEQVELVAVWNSESFDEQNGTVGGTLTAPADYVFENGESAMSVTANVTIVHRYDEDKEVSVCEGCHEYIRTKVDYVMPLDASAGLAALDGWTFAADGDGSSDTDAYACYAADAHSTAQSKLDRNAIAIYKNEKAFAAYELSKEATVRQLVIKLSGGSSSAFTNVIQFTDANGAVVKTQNPSLSAGDWKENTFTYTNIENVKKITVYGATKWIGLTSFELSYERIEKAVSATLTLDVNGGAALEQNAYTVWAGEKVTLPEATRAADADGTTYNFMGWTDGEEDYPAGYEYVVTETATLAAKWQKIAKGTVVTEVEVVTERTAFIGEQVELPDTATVCFEGGSADVAVTVKSGEYDVTKSGVYTLIMGLDDQNGLYDLGEYATYEYTLTVYYYKVVAVPAIRVFVKVGGTIKLETVAVTYAAYVGDRIMEGAVYETAEREVVWNEFVGGAVGEYTATGKLVAEDGWVLGDFENVQATVEVYDFDEAGVKTVYIGSQNAFNALAEEGFAANENVSFDNGKTDAYLGAKIAGGGRITFTLLKTTHIILGVSSDKATAYVNFYKQGDVTETAGETGETVSTQNYLKQISTFTDNKYQTIDMTLEAGTYVLENGASGTGNNFSLTYVVVDDGGQEAFIPTASSYMAPENTDKSGFIGWYNGTTLYTVGARMPVAANNNGIIAYTAVYNALPAFDMGDEYVALGWLLDGTTIKKEFDKDVSGEWVAIFAKAEWLNGAAIKIVGASTEKDDDASAMKFKVFVTLSGGYAANLVNNGLIGGLVTYRVTDGENALTVYAQEKAASANVIEIEVFVEKIASLGLLRTPLSAGIGIGGAEYVQSNAYTAEYVALRALADFVAQADQTHKYYVADGEGGAYSYYNDDEREGLNVYVRIAERQGSGAANIEMEFFDVYSPDHQLSTGETPAILAAAQSGVIADKFKLA